MPGTPYHGRVFRNVRCLAATGMLPVAGLLAALTLLGACGEPPQPSLTAPPRPPGSGSVSASGYPSGIVPTMPATVPTTGLPAYPTAGMPTTYPAYPTYPTYPTSTTTPPATATSPTRTGPPPAPKCTKGPSAQQVLAAVKNRPGVPTADLKIIAGPYCAGTWQFSTVEIAAADAEDKYEPLQVVSNGKPETLKVIEAGTDVCSVKIQNEAPPGIRVRACGA
jgi:hypothetical protein